MGMDKNNQIWNGKWMKYGSANSEGQQNWVGLAKYLDDLPMLNQSSGSIAWTKDTVEMRIWDNEEKIWYTPDI